MISTSVQNRVRSGQKLLDLGKAEVGCRKKREKENGRKRVNEESKRDSLKEIKKKERKKERK